MVLLTDILKAKKDFPAFVLTHTLRRARKHSYIYVRMCCIVGGRIPGVVKHSSALCEISLCLLSLASVGFV